MCLQSMANKHRGIGSAVCDMGSGTSFVPSIELGAGGDPQRRTAQARVVHQGFSWVHGGERAISFVIIRDYLWSSFTKNWQAFGTNLS